MQDKTGRKKRSEDCTNRKAKQAKNKKVNSKNFYSTMTLQNKRLLCANLNNFYYKSQDNKFCNESSVKEVGV